MSKEGIFNRFVCDRPASAHSDGKERREYVKEGNVKENDWHQIGHVDVNGASTNYCLCGDCYAAYLDLVSSYDAQLSAFIRGDAQ